MRRNPRRLQRILRVRQLQEETARGRWIQAQVAAREADAQVQQSEQNIALGQDFVRGQQSLGSVDGVLQGDAAMLHLQRALQRMGALRVQRHQEVETAKAPWVETRKAARGMEKLVERARDEQRIERQHKEDQALESSLEALLTRKENNKQTPLSA